MQNKRNRNRSKQANKKLYILHLSPFILFPFLLLPICAIQRSGLECHRQAWRSRGKAGAASFLMFFANIIRFMLCFFVSFILSFFHSFFYLKKGLSSFLFSSHLSLFMLSHSFPCVILPAEKPHWEDAIADWAVPPERHGRALPLQSVEKR